MSIATSPGLRWFGRRRNLRLASGLVLFTYVTLHLASHALGLVSLADAEAALRAGLLLWHGGPGTVLLYGAVAVHVGLALLAIYDRRTLRMAPLNALRIVMGLVMPLSLIGHFVGTRYAFEHFRLAADYARIAGNLWTSGAQGLTLGLLAPGWVHGCLGLRFALGHLRAWHRLRLPLFGAALLLPVLAALGFVSMGRELSALHPVPQPQARPDASERSVLEDMRKSALATYLALISLVLLARTVRGLDERRRKMLVNIAYPGRLVSVPQGWSVLEASRGFGIPHKSICGGRGRCSTCRVLVVSGLERCPAADVEERQTLERIGAPDAVRLACQLRPTGDVSVEPLLGVEFSRWSSSPPERPATEGDVALLFFDVRLGVDPAGSKASAHDTIYALAQFHTMLEAVIEPGNGAIASRRADHWVALFGLGSEVREGCRQALDAARRIEQQATIVRGRLLREMGLRTDFTIGVHVGSVVAGTIGRGEARTLSAVGDVIDAVASLQTFAASRAAHFVISRQAVAAAGLEDAALDWQRADADAQGTPPLFCAAPATAAGLS